MKLVLFQPSVKSDVLPGLLTDRGVVAIAGVVELSYTPQLTMEGIIDDFENLRPALERLAAEGDGLVEQLLHGIWKFLCFKGGAPHKEQPTARNPRLLTHPKSSFAYILDSRIF